MHEETASDIIKLWGNFKEIYEIMTDKKTSEFSAETVFRKTQSFIKDLLAVGRKNREGYQPSNVTPYLHTLVYHLPYFLEKYGSLSKFSGHGVEKTSDIIKSIYHGKTNKSDPTSDALVTRKRLELGFQTELSRKKRKYDKVNDDYWGSRIVGNRRSKMQRILEEQKMANESNNKIDETENFDELSVSEKRNYQTWALSQNCGKKKS